MSKRESIIRYSLIINKLRKKPSTLKEIAANLSLESEYQGYNFNISDKTFKRDLDDIRSIYNIDICYDYSRKVYYIDSEQPELSNRILEAFDTFNALNITERLSDYIHFEKRKPQGTENLYGLLHAIKNHVHISFTYQKYWEDTLSKRSVEPYALKEFKSRWYLLANDLKDNKVKTFALDRLTDPEITNKKFQMPADFSISEYFKSCFGIINSNGEQPEEIILSFDSHQGKYIKSLPLHESQEILKDTKDELKIKLNIVITHDFIMELLSYGYNMQVLKPDSLIVEMKTIYQEALSLYK